MAIVPWPGKTESPTTQRPGAEHVGADGQEVAVAPARPVGRPTAPAVRRV